MVLVPRLPGQPEEDPRLLAVIGTCLVGVSKACFGGLWRWYNKPSKTQLYWQELSRKMDTDAMKKRLESLEKEIKDLRANGGVAAAETASSSSSAGGVAAAAPKKEEPKKEAKPVTVDGCFQETGKLLLDSVWNAEIATVEAILEGEHPTMVKLVETASADSVLGGGDKQENMDVIRDRLLNKKISGVGGERQLTPLMAAANIGNLRLMSMLVRTYKANPDFLDENKNNALFQAIDARQLESVVYLVRDLKVDLKKKNADNQTALDLATHYKWDRVVEGLNKHLGNPIKPIPQSATIASV
jgi:hypothetical protein